MSNRYWIDEAEAERGRFRELGKALEEPDFLLMAREQNHRETWGKQRKQLQGSGRKRRKAWD